MVDFCISQFIYLNIKITLCHKIHEEHSFIGEEASFKRVSNWAKGVLVVSGGAQIQMLASPILKSGHSP